MLKKNLPGFPCAPRINPNFCAYDEINQHCTICLKGVVGGMVDGSCSCCSNMNGEEFYWKVFGAGGSHISSVGDICNGFFAIGVGGARTSFACSCMGDRPTSSQFMPLFEFECNQFYFILNASFVPNVGSPSTAFTSIIFGWYDPNGESGLFSTNGADRDTAAEAIRDLMDGGTARLPIALGGSSGPICDTTGAYLDVTISDCPDIVPDPPFDPNEECEACDDFTFACLGETTFDSVNLSVSGLLDCSIENASPQIYQTYSNLNGNYTLTRRTEAGTVPGCNGFTPWNGFEGSVVYWAVEIGIPNTTGTPAPYEDLGEPWYGAVYDYPLNPFFPLEQYTQTLEEIVWSVGAVAGCEDGAFRFGYIEFATQIFVVIRHRGDGEIIFLDFLGTSCHRYQQDDSAFRQDACVSIQRCSVLGSGSVSAFMEYDLCGSTETFGATLVMSPVTE